MENNDTNEETPEIIVSSPQEPDTETEELLSSPAETVENKDVPEVNQEKVANQNPENTVKARKIKVPLKKAFYGILLLIIIGVGVIVFLFGSQIARGFNFGTNEYGFDYNFNKVKSHDWDSLLTEKKISQALGVSAQKINTVKNPDYSWVLEAPEELVNQVICGSIMEEKILYEKSDTENNLFNVSIMLCKDTKKGLELFQTRKDNLQLLVVQDPTVKIQEVNEGKDLGEGSYDYILEKTTPATEEQTDSITESYSGLVFYRGPFIVRIEEAQQGDFTVLSLKETRLDLAKHMDREIKNSLSLF